VKQRVVVQPRGNGEPAKHTGKGRQTQSRGTLRRVKKKFDHKPTLAREKGGAKTKISRHSPWSVASARFLAYGYTTVAGDNAQIQSCHSCHAKTRSELAVPSAACATGVGCIRDHALVHPRFK
jgi:hypothetical protein